MADTIDNEIAYDEQANPFDANDADGVAAKENNATRLKEKRLRIVEAIMSSEAGRDWMNNLLGTECHVFSENTMRDTPERNGRFEGERGVGLRVLGEIMTAAPEMFWKMRCEAVERDRRVSPVKT